MIKLKLKKKKIKKFKKVYTLVLANTKKTTKYNKYINLGTYIPNIKAHTFLYSSIINLSKLGSSYSDQFSLISLFSLNKIIKYNF